MVVLTGGFAMIVERELERIKEELIEKEHQLEQAVAQLEQAYKQLNVEMEEAQRQLEEIKAAGGVPYGGTFVCLCRYLSHLVSQTLCFALFFCAAVWWSERSLFEVHETNFENVVCFAAKNITFNFSQIFSF
jgi:hypothetical protein